LAYSMEKALQLFYENLQQQSQDQEVKELFGQLARVEIRHEERLFETYRQIEPGAQDRESFEAAIAPNKLEGGFDAEEFLETNKSHLQTSPQVLDLAMMLETQALDLYLRFADRCKQAQTREVLFSLAGEEKAHLASLGRLLDEKVAK
jgi:sulfur-carrier protein adenylyltransferase/sulfurtransferase